MKYLDYRRKLGLGFNDKDREKYFMTRMSNYLGELDLEDLEIDYSFCYDYFNTLGVAIEDYYDDGIDKIIERLKEITDVLEFIAEYILFVNMIKERGIGTDEYLELFSDLENNLEASEMAYEVIKDKDGAFIFPKGAEELDVSLISEPLSWMEAYPKSRVAFTKALREYSVATSKNASDIADKFRKTLETFMQEFFKCEKSLENMKVIYGTFLKDHDVPKEVANNLETLLQAYTNYINNYSKHRDKTNKNILEYLLYQTGNIIRLLITLDGEK